MSNSPTIEKLSEIETLVGKLCDTVKTIESSNLDENTKQVLTQNLCDFALSEIISRWPGEKT